MPWWQRKPSAADRWATAAIIEKIAPGWRAERDKVSKQIEAAHKLVDDLRKAQAALWSFKDVKRWDFDNYLSQGKEIPPERRALYADADEVASERTAEKPQVNLKFQKHRSLSAST